MLFASVQEQIVKGFQKGFCFDLMCSQFAKLSSSFGIY